MKGINFAALSSNLSSYTRAFRLPLQHTLAEKDIQRAGGYFTA